VKEKNLIIVVKSLPQRFPCDKSKFRYQLSELIIRNLFLIK